MSYSAGGIPPNNDEQKYKDQISNDEKSIEQLRDMQDKWEHWIGPNATPEDIKKFLAQLIKDMISQIQKDEQKAIAALKKMQAAEEGNDDDSD